MQTQACRSCGAPIIWAVTATAKLRIPVDAKPSPGGMLSLVWGEGPVPVAVPSSRQPTLLGPLYKSHFATCPSASLWRRKG